jgi:hypothetical protein
MFRMELKRGMRGNLLVNAGLAIGGLAVGVLLGEVILRLLGVYHPIFYRADFYLGQSGRPGAEGWQTEEGRAYIRLNDEGLRDVEHPKQKGRETFKIAILGDSFAEGVSVRLDQTFWKVMELDLSLCTALGKRKVEVINFGVEGYGTAQELIMLRRFAWAYSPNLVVLLFTPGNDFRDNSRVLDPMKMRPFFVLMNGNLVPDNSFRNSPRFRFSSSWFWRTFSRIADYSRTAQLAFYLPTIIHRERQERIKEQYADGLGLDLVAFRPPSDAAWKNAWAVTERLLETIHWETKAHGAAFLVVTDTNPAQVDPDPAVAQALADRVGVPDLLYSERRIASLGAKDGFAVLNLAQPFAAYAQQRHLYLHGFKNTKMGGGHWNVEGHRLAGELVAHKVCRMQSTRTHL